MLVLNLVIISAVELIYGVDKEVVAKLIVGAAAENAEAVNILQDI